MALSLSDGATDLINHGTATALDNMAQATVMMWIFLDNVNNAIRGFAGKTNSGTLTTGWGISRNNTDGTRIDLRVNRATTDQTASSSTGVLQASQWQLVAVTWDITNGGPKIYWGDLDTVVVDVTNSAADGSGTQDDDSTFDLVIGNILTGGARAIPGDIAWAAVYNRDLSLEEIRFHQYRQRFLSSNCLIFSHYGYNGTGTQTDWSGNGNGGSVTGATQANHAPLSPPFASGIGWKGAFTAAVAGTGWGQLLSSHRNRLVYVAG